MLDQNTDRMWYVIGAVIVGAALIFLMNGIFPTLFANVGESFEDKVGETTEMTDGIMPVSSVVQLKNPSFANGHNGWYTNGTTRPETVDGRSVMLVQPGEGSMGGGVYQMAVLKKSVAVEVTFEARAVSGTARPYVGFLNTGNAKDNKIFVATEDWQTFRFETSVIDHKVVSHNMFHIYSNYSNFYVDNVRIRPLSE